MKFLSLPLLCLALFLIPIANAQETYVQPMFTIAWTSRTILVSVPTNPSWAENQVIKGMEIWNQAQAWFLASYEPQNLNAYYTLALAKNGQTPQVTIVYVTSIGNNIIGLTSSQGTHVSFVLSKLDDDDLAPHEFGHVLGLGDNSIAGDLMALKGYTLPNPSTLDLYAVYMQAVSGGQYGTGNTVTLPSTIPYTTWTQGATPLPEFGNCSLASVVSCLVLALTITRRRRN